MRPLDYVSARRTGAAQSQHAVKNKDKLSRLVEITGFPADIAGLATLRNFNNVEKYIENHGVDVVIAGHKNQFLGTLTSSSAEFINHLSVDVLIHHL